MCDFNSDSSRETKFVSHRMRWDGHGSMFFFFTHKTTSTSSLFLNVLFTKCAVIFFYME